MHLQIILISVIACAYCRSVSVQPNKPNVPNSRQKRTTLFDYEKQIRSHPQHRNTLYNIEEEIYGGTSDSVKSSEESGVLHNSGHEQLFSANNKPVHEDIDMRHFESSQESTKVVPGNKYEDNVPSSVIAKRATSSMISNRRAFDSQPHFEKYDEDKIMEKRYSQPGLEEDEHHHYAHPKYDFKYTVHDVEHHDIKHHQEERDGDQTVGEYSLLQPDGTILTVKYTVSGDEGFNAIVSKSEDANGYLKEYHHKEYEHPKIHERPKIHDHRFESDF